MYRYRLGLYVVLAFFAFVSTSVGQSTAFSYQGRLQLSGLPASGNFDIEFSIFDDPLAGNQQGTTQTIPAVPVVSGVFTATIDFGLGIFIGPPRYLQIAIKPAGSPGAFTQLNPRTQVLAVPYAMKSSSADTATFATNAGAATNAAQLGGIPANQYLQTGSAPVVGDIQFTGHVLLAPATPLSKAAGVTPPATLHAINPAPGITNPSPTNLPPAAVRGDATSTTGTNVGVLGQAYGENGIGVLGAGRGTAGAAVLALHTGTTGETVGLSGEISSPNGTVLDLNMPSGGNGHLIYASRGAEPNTQHRFSVASDGQTTITGSLHLNGNQEVQGNMSVSGSYGGVNATVVSTGNLFADQASVTGTISTFSVSASNITTNSLSVSGPKNNVVTLKDGRTVLLYANESPEYWFEDFGTVQLKNGRAIVKIDPTFSETTNTAIDYKVFLTANGNTRGLYVVRKSATTFEVRENRRGRSNISFDYRIVAKRRGYEDVRFGPSRK